MSVYTQACGVAILVVLLILFTINRPKIFLHTEKLFIATLIASMFANIVDIVCQFVMYYNSVPNPVIIVLCKLYQILVLMVLCLTMMYVSRDIYNDSKRFVIRTWYYPAIFLVSSVIVFILPEELNLEPGRLYAHGISVAFSYTVALIYIIAVLVRVNVLAGRMNSDRRIAINLWMVMWMLVGILEYFNPSVFMSGFATSIGVMIIYVKLENPGMNMDRKSGLYNQNAFNEYIRQLYGEYKKFAVFVMVSRDYDEAFQNKELDLTKIKRVVDVEGAVIFKKADNEIAIVFESIKDAAKWRADYLENIRNSINPDMMALKNALWVNIDNSELFKNADELIYFTKYVISNVHARTDMLAQHFIDANEEMVEAMRAEKAIERMIEKALRDNRVLVYYQPIFSTEKQRFTAAEALVRIRDRDGRIVPPGEFIPIAEKNGTIIDIGNEVFRQVCKFIKEENPSQYGIEYIEVNLSVAQCADEALAENYIDAMRMYDINPKHINLEITESVSAKSKEVLLDNMNRLIEYGVNFSLDDFGTGQSNLNYIVDMPADIVKFDKDMINAYLEGNNKKAKYVMDAAMHMIHGMGLKIVSEGIETSEQYDKMSEMGISYIQGYYFSKPLEKEEFVKYLADNNT